jgi:hypothetical protein
MFRSGGPYQGRPLFAMYPTRAVTLAQTSISDLL